MDGTFEQLSLVIAVATGVSLIMRLIRQPMIIGYILTGILVGPAVLRIVESTDTLDVFSDFGIALLLLIIGLGLNPKVIKEIGKIAANIGIGKVVIATGVAFVAARLLGYNPTPAIFIGITMSFSSAIIILKLLSDKGEQNRLYGKISVGFLLIEVFIAILVLIGLSATSHGGFSFEDLGVLILKIGLLVAGLYVVRRFLLEKIASITAQNQEFLFLFTIGWGLGLAALFKQAGLSLEIGSLIAGVMLAPLPYAQEAASRLKPLRDFFIVLFFIAIGSHLQVANILTTVPEALIFSFLILVGNPLIVLAIMGISGYTKKTSFKTAVNSAQISEFSLIIILLAEEYGRVNEGVVSLVTLIGIITIGVSTYMITYADNLYAFFEHMLHFFERKKVKSEREYRRHYDLVLFGYKKGGSEFIKLFKSLGKPYVVVDYDPRVIETLQHTDAHYLYGDVGDLELLEELNLDQTKLLVSTISDPQINLSLLRYLQKQNPKIVFICSADNGEQAAELYKLGAAYIMLPHYIGSEKISAFIKKSGLKKTEFKKFREKHLAYLQAHHEFFGTTE